MTTLLDTYIDSWEQGMVLLLTFGRGVRIKHPKGDFVVWTTRLTPIRGGKAHLVVVGKPEETK